MDQKKVMVGMSGGVDSAVAAALLIEQGYLVIGVTMKIVPDSQFSDDNIKRCCSLDDVEDARAVAGKLGIPYYVMNFQKEFDSKVINYFADEYVKGRTPHPCIACNKYIKFDSLLVRAEAMGIDYSCDGAVCTHRI